jgi:hypothetical protein
MVNFLATWYNVNSSSQSIKKRLKKGPLMWPGSKEIEMILRLLKKINHTGNAFGKQIRITMRYNF